MKLGYILVVALIACSCGKETMLMQSNKSSSSKNTPSLNNPATSNSTSSIFNKSNSCNFDNKDMTKWRKVSSYKFSFLESLNRAQGVTSNEQGKIWFSGNITLLRSDIHYLGWTEMSNFWPFSIALTRIGIDHIGDIDIHENDLYASLQDARKFNHPIVGVYDASSLRLKKTFLLPLDWQSDGVPWVAVDHIKKVIVSSHFGSVKKINLYDMINLWPVRQIDIDTTISGIQGGKIVGKYLLVNANDDISKRFAMYSINLETGAVKKLILYPNDVREIEGLSIVASNSGCNLYTLAQTGKNLGVRMELYDYLFSY
ncbi:MAG: hypothetical protein H7281_07500 [Bacteriovorax sp.]|nr:hypothetical protein [Bacteriovorax sp.]